jgi:p-aminobenzoyl-glutamate transporter AbgT
MAKDTGSYVGASLHDEEPSSPSVSESEPKSFSTTTDTNNPARDQSTSSDETLAKQETKAVIRSKWVVLAVIFVAAVACATATYFFVKKEENQRFESQVSK